MFEVRPLAVALIVEASLRTPKPAKAGFDGGSGPNGWCRSGESDHLGELDVL